MEEDREAESDGVKSTDEEPNQSDIDFIDDESLEEDEPEWVVWRRELRDRREKKRRRVVQVSDDDEDWFNKIEKSLDMHVISIKNMKWIFGNMCQISSESIKHFLNQETFFIFKEGNHQILNSR